MSSYVKSMDWKEFWTDIGFDVMGSILIAVSLYNFAAAALLPMAGISGIALIFYQLFGIPMGAFSLLMNIPLILGTYRILGKRFFLKSIHSIIISSFFIDFVAPLFPVYQGERMLACICCAAMSGLGYALIYMRESSTGGVDFVTMAIRKKRPHLSVGRISFALDTIVILASCLTVSRDVDSFLYGIINNFILAYVIDKVMYGTDEGKMALIVTNIGQEICVAIDEVCGRGSTILKGRGSYSGEDKDIVMCACNSKQMFGIRRMIKQVDPKAFMVIVESNDVVGEGFKDI